MAGAGPRRAGPLIGLAEVVRKQHNDVGLLLLRIGMQGDRHTSTEEAEGRGVGGRGATGVSAPGNARGGPEGYGYPGSISNTSRELAAPLRRYTRDNLRGRHEVLPLYPARLPLSR